MDPLTQGVFGAIAAQLPAPRQQLRRAAIIGAVAGMSPDLDVLIRSNTDPLLALEYHRHFTHALLFIPIGGLLCGLLAYAVLGKVWRLNVWQCVAWAVLGFATHGLLDACTSYGTRLLWPVRDQRIAWDLVSVIDPVFSGVLALLLIVGLLQHKRVYAVACIGWIAIYFFIAAVQHQRALTFGETLAANRGHQIHRLHAKPSFGNIVVWKIIYQHDQTFFVDAVKLGFTRSRYWSGQSIDKLDIARDFPWLDPQSQQARDIERFREFSADFVALDPVNPHRIGDIRYSQLPQEIKPLWAIELSASATADQHAIYVTQRDNSSQALQQLLHMIWR